MLYDYGRITNLEGIIDEFDRLNDEFKDSASVITATQLDEERKQN